MDQSQTEVLARELYEAERVTRVLEPLTRRHPGMSMERLELGGFEYDGRGFPLTSPITRGGAA